MFALLPKLLVGCVKTPLPSNPITYPEYLYLSTSVFLDYFNYTKQTF